MTKCKVCGDIDKFPIAQALAAPVPCRKCGHYMDIRTAAIEASETSPGANKRAPNGDGPASSHEGD